MSQTPQTDLELALDSFTHAVEAWDPDTSPGLDSILDALRALHLKFDPRKDRVSAAMCMTSMKLLETLQVSGSIGCADAMGAIGELSFGLREALAQTSAPASRPTSRDSMVMLGGPAAAPASSGLSLAIGGIQERTLDQVMVGMSMLTREQADHVLQVQSEGAGEDPARPFGEVAMELGYASEMTVESALRLQARAEGQVPDPQAPSDAWGNSPL